MKLGLNALLQLDHVLPPPRVRTTQMPPLRVLTLLSMELPEISHDFRILEANLGSQGTNKLINDIYNIMQHQNSKAVEERFIFLEESLHNAHPLANSVQEVMPKRNHSTPLEPSTTR